jgi:flagellar biosynthesis protein FliR
MDLLDTAQRILAQAGIQANLQSFLVLYGLCLARLAGVISQAPFFGGNSVPGQVKLGFAAILAAVLYPSITPPQGLAQPISPLLFFALLLKEAFIGLVIGILAQIVFYAVQMAGTLIDSQRGANQMNFLAPQLAGPTSALGQLQFQAALVLFLGIDGHLLFLRGLHTSFSQIGILELPRLSNGLLPVVDQMARITGDAIIVALILSAPVLISLFLVDVSFGILNRTVAQLQIHTESQPAKAFLGLGVLLLALALIFDRLLEFIARALAQVFALIRSFG